MECLRNVNQFLCLLLLCLNFQATLSSSTYSSLATQVCSHEESAALIQFKRSFSLDKDASKECGHNGILSYPKTDSWKEGTDCCSWDGISCDNATGQVIALDLSCSWLYGTIPSNSSLFLLRHLQKLKLAYNDFHNSMISPDQFGQLANLLHLNLSSSGFSGLIPNSIFNLMNLTYLDLSSNNLSGTLELNMLSKLQNLEGLDLSYNTLSLNSDIDVDYTLPNLQYLQLVSCNISEFPHFLSRFEGLQHLDLSYNNLSLNSDIDLNYALPNLQYLRLSSCNISDFPHFLSRSEGLQHLDLSNNRISGQIPKWMWDVGKDSLSLLNLSLNSLTHLEQLPWKNMNILDLHSNLIQGSLPILPLDTRYFSISNNKLTGEINSFICNVKFLSVLDLSQNFLVGIIPKCLAKLSNLLVLNLGMNKLNGTIPSTFAKGCALKYLNLNGNLLEGPMTESIKDCRSLELFDLGKNNINDTFPHWLGALPGLRVLILHSNSFHGSIYGSRTNHSFQNLQILDLSNNNFCGPLPASYIKSLKQMMHLDQNFVPYMEEHINNYSVIYDYSTGPIRVKGLDMIGSAKFLTMYTGIDLSSNKFEGEIPRIIGELSSLSGLNLSHNRLSGHIPSSLGNLTNLEWLDLSANALTGMIPEELVGLLFLAVLNLSNNQLVGPVPREKQFATFDNSSYEGNEGLCDCPLSRPCKNPEPRSPPSLTLMNSNKINGYKIGFGW
ncbi:Receptor like protein 26 [Theobroma cacao]|uniref:Receptor like protein 26 n=1 Tax=Theobroma cacao TaxID=3641 RepID=A0A061F7M8_THECC|nr:Receptor like protein 26 [Theobroma cacao]